MLNSVSAIIVRKKDNKVFIGKRSSDKKFSPLKWETIGGRMKKGELPEQALKREIKEELSVGVKSLSFFRDYYFDKRIFKTFIVELEKEPTVNKKDFQGWGWFSLEEIEKMDFCIDCKKRIIDYFKINL